MAFNTVKGTSGKISVSGEAPTTVTIDPTYIGQTSITTLGTITTGTWNGSILTGQYGGTGVNNGANTITIGGNISTAGALTTSGAYGVTFNFTNTTNVTFPTSGTLSTTTGTVTNIATGTGLTGGPITSTGTISVANSTANTLAGYNNIGVFSDVAIGSGLSLSGGTLTASGSGGTVTSLTAGTGITLTPSTITTTGTIALTTPVALANGGTNNNITADNGAIVYSDASKLTLLASISTAGCMLRSGSNSSPSPQPTWSSTIWPNTCTLGNLLYASSTNTITGLATAANSTLITDGSGIPSISQTLPTAVQNNITGVGTLTGGTWHATVLESQYGGTGVNNGTNHLTLGGAVTFSGAFSFTANITGNTNVTFPTSGTLSTTTGTVTSITAGTGLTGGTITNSGTIALSTPVSLTNGGTNASLTASNGGIVWSNASQLQILSGTSTANQVLLSGATATPAWSTATYPATTTINQILYSSAANTVTGITTANSSILATNTSGVPAFTTILPSVTAGGAIIPAVDNTYALGTTVDRWGSVVTGTLTSTLHIDNGSNMILGSNVTGTTALNMIVNTAGGAQSLANISGNSSTGQSITLYSTNTGATFGSTTYNAVTYNLKFAVLGTGAVQNYTNSYGSLSDLNKKTNIKSARNYLDDFMKLEFIKYDFNDDIDLNNLSRYFGLGAQQVEEVFPSLIDENEDGTKTLKYSILYCIGMKVIQELAQKITDLENKLNTQ